MNICIIHIAIEFSKALSFITRFGQQFKNPETLIRLYFALVISHFEYVSVI